MRVEVLYVADCPSYPLAVAMLAEILAEEGIAPEIRQVLVGDEEMARELAFRGSPTIRIEGVDVACDTAEAPAFAVCCRLYHDSPQLGVPPAEIVRRAVRAACREGTEP